MAKTKVSDDYCKGGNYLKPGSAKVEVKKAPEKTSARKRG